MSKPRIVKDYEKLSDEVLEQLKLVYPLGFRRHLVQFKNREGILKKGLPFETEDYYYLIRMTEEKAMHIIAEDEDFDEEGVLKDDVKKSYEDKHVEEAFLNEFNSNDDNDLGEEIAAEADMDMDEDED